MTPASGADSGSNEKSDQSGATSSKLDETLWLKTIADMPNRYAMLGERHLIDAEAKRRGVRASGTGWSKQAYRAAISADPLTVADVTAKRDVRSKR